MEPKQLSFPHHPNSGVAQREVVLRRGLALAQELLPGRTIHRGFRLRLYEQSFTHIYDLPSGVSNLRVLWAHNESRYDFVTLRPDERWVYFANDRNELAVMPCPSGPVQHHTRAEVDSLLSRSDMPVWTTVEGFRWVLDELLDDSTPSLRVIPTFRYIINPRCDSDRPGQEPDFVPITFVRAEGNGLSAGHERGMPWSVEFDSPVRLPDEPTDKCLTRRWKNRQIGGCLYLAHNDSVRCLNVLDGTARWNYRCQDRPDSLLLGPYLYVVIANHLVTLDLESGVPVWSFVADSTITARLEYKSPWGRDFPDWERALLFVGTKYGTVYWLQGWSGLEMGSVRMPGEVTRITWPPFAGIIVDTVAPLENPIPSTPSVTVTEGLAQP